ncbi:hypothetical protein EMIHUDRAFT_220635 [Emiliania huxleyi CCMP1516]|uniref:Uncharacterized protein n=2 Tax=Emiliania huxleyi TaxID=2903 RepID=A0A0D3I0R7_EMIH1|nr:hypothetical protein EMIHUDRAFT_220635 [Emiliania huxleyi CCMP1516]EOD04852.1 hypothetical protein EMIHUDRAFT_220635 [Emiliania huxleyi CCMP1516]|eukprot:XP_005757281.1 hypothetical protein EMIHUDRAFT_220635 [Emiliania huxleyi CCMP1516]
MAHERPSLSHLADKFNTEAPPGYLSGDAGDTRDLDLGGTERFEVERTSMSQAEAGYAIEPFNMKQERAEGHFDDDFNYVWKRRGDEADETNDARKLIAAQIEQIGTQDEADS